MTSDPSGFRANLSPFGLSHFDRLRTGSSKPPHGGNGTSKGSVRTGYGGVGEHGNLKRPLKLGFIRLGAGGGWGDWRHPDANPRGSTDFDLYKRQTLLAEAGRFGFVFVADSVHINERSSPHYLNRFEPLTVLSHWPP